MKVKSTFKISKSKQLFKKANEVLVGGVNSPVRSFRYTGCCPLLIKNASDSKVYDYDNREYIDYVLSYGALILGHAHPEVVEDVTETLKSGFSFGATTHLEVSLAQEIIRAIPLIEKLRFVNSGTEATMSAVRLARGYTKRDKIVKFTNSYHGHADSFLAKSGSGLATLNIPLSRGVPFDFTKHTISLDYGNNAQIEKTFRLHGSEIAAVIVEPVGGNHGVIPLDINFLKHLRIITSEYNTLLIFDEVITAFRFSYGAVSNESEVVPDLICLGKIIGGGLPVGAYGGREEIMNNLAPEGEVYQASTFAGNPVVMQAGISTLRVLFSRREKYSCLFKMAEGIAGFIKKQAEMRGLSVNVLSYGPMFSIKFSDKGLFRKFYKGLLVGGIFFAPSEYETNFVSFAHTSRDIDKTKKVIREALERI
ncbi:MAG: glutamate-1-semialdehyde 2,1-aminomutase [Candidatus Omnitrophota bacterium]